MVQMQVRLTPEHKHLAASEGKSVAELIRSSMDKMIRSGGSKDPDELRRKAMAATGKFSGPANLSEKHDEYYYERI